MSDGEPDAVLEDAAVQALIRAYVACRVARDALPELPDEIADAVADHITAFCDVIGPALAEAHPGFFDRELPGNG